jgi:hypothetical protein
MKTKGKKSVIAKYEKMRPKELKAASAKFDQELVVEESRPLNAEERALWAKARRKPGRPKVGRGVRVISVSVERGLLGRSDALAQRLGISRASLVSRGLKAVLAAEGRL